MSGLNSGDNKDRICHRDLCRFIGNESAWADFFITRIGLILFSAMLLTLVFKVYPLFQDRETGAELDFIASDIVSKIESMDSTSISGYRNTHVFDKNKKNIEIAISTESIVSRIKISDGKLGEKELRHIESFLTYVYPPNSYFRNSSGLREYLGEKLCKGRNGDISKPLDFSKDKQNVDTMFVNIQKELALTPFSPDVSKPLIMEKIILAYADNTDFQYEDFILIYQ